MKKFASMIVYLCVSIIGHAQEKTYTFFNMFSISVSEDLELRKESDTYTKFLYDTLNYVTNCEIVFQPKGLSDKKKDALDHYCRIMILSDKDNSCPYPSSNEKSFSDDELNELLSDVYQEQEALEYVHFVVYPTASIESTHSGATYIKFHYTRNGTKGDVSVNICYFFNYDCFVKAIFSYRESEEDLWKQKLSRALNSFAWKNPYTAHVYSQEDAIRLLNHNNNNLNFWLFGIVIGFLIAIIFGFNLIIVKRKKNLRKQIEEKIVFVQDLILHKKAVSAITSLNELKALKTKNITELQEKISLITRLLETLKSEIDQKVDSQIDTIKKEFAENPDKISNYKVSELLINKEIPKEQKDKINLEIKFLEEEYKNGVIPEQHKAYVNYDIEQSTRNGYYAFYTAPAAKTEIFPYRRRKVELRGYTEGNFEQMLRNSLKSSTHYHVLGDVSIHTSEGSHPYEPDIAIVEMSDNYGVRIDIEIDEPYGGYDKTPIHYVGCGDEFRDRILANLGWLVVRFSEKQIFQEPENCIYYIQKLISLIDPSFSITCVGNNPKPDKCWTEHEAHIMVIQRFRENLLHHEFGKEKKDGISITTPLTELEKDVANNAKPIHLPITPQHNIDKTNTKFAQDSLLSFEPSEHIYLYNGRIQLTAISNIISQFFTPFDSIGLSDRIARRDGVSQCEVLEDWYCKGLESREVGTFLHSQIESMLSNKPLSTNMHFCYNGEFLKVSKDISIDEEISYFQNFLKDNPITPFRTEWHIFDMELKIAGTIDLLCRNGRHFDIYDWKRSRKASPNMKVWQYGFNGLQHVPDIKFFHYALQQNLYKYILEKNYGIIVENMYIIVLHPIFGNYQKFKIPDMAEEVAIIKSHIV